MLTNSIYDLNEEQLTEALSFYRNTVQGLDLPIVRKMAMERLDLFPELALITETGKLFRNARHHIEWYGILQSFLIQENNDKEFSPKSLIYNDIGYENKRIIVEAPREHSKTTCFSVAYPLWRIVNNPNIRTILVSNTLTQAESYLREIKGHIERDPIFNELFGSLSSKFSEKWTNQEIIVERTALNLKDPTVSAVGMGGAILSRRAELIIVDDILNQGNVNSQEQRQKVKEWFWNVLMPVLTPNGTIVVVGTAWNNDDILEDLLSKSTFDVQVRYKAVPDESDIDQETGKPKVLWNGLFTYDQLMTKKADDPISFYRQYQNDVRQMSNVPVKDEWIRWCDYAQLPKFKHLVIGIDPAISEKDTGNTCESAICMVGRGVDDKYYVVKDVGGFWGFDELLNTAEFVYWDAKTMFNQRPRSVVVEDVQAQKWAIDMLRKKKRLPAFGIKPTTDKTARLMTLQPFFKNNEILFTPDCKTLVNQLVGWGREKLKDRVDAFVYAMWQLTERPVARVATEK